MSDLFAPYSTWLHTLPLWSQPVVETFIPCFALLALLAIRHRVALYRKGEKFSPGKKHPAEMVGAVLFCCSLLYCRDRYPAVAQVVNWPNRFPMWRDHGGAMTVGFLAACMAATALSVLFAAVFLRGSGSRGVSGIGIGVRVRPVRVRSVWVEHSSREE